MARGDQGARFVHWEAKDRGEAHLGNFLDEEAVSWQDITDHAQVVQLRLHALDGLLGGGLGFSQLRITPFGSAVLEHCLGQGRSAIGCVGHQVDVRCNAAHFSRVDIDTNQLQPCRAVAPANIQQLEA
ncbi:hypothetical protein D3C80_1386630 [compost metagenome]